MDKNTVKLARYRSLPYTVNYQENGVKRKYVWTGSKGDRYQIHDIPDYVFSWLQMASTCIQDGELVVVEEDKKKKEEVMMGVDEEELNKNTHTRKEIEKILKGNTNTMKKKLNDITVDSEKQFIIKVAKEIKLDSSTKRNFLKEWSGIDLDIVLEDEKK